MRNEHVRPWRLYPVLLLAQAPALASAAEPSPTWVFFTDRGREGQELSSAIDERVAELSPRALERRVRTRGDLGVDARDLAPAPAYVAAVLDTGAELRSTSRWLNAISVDADPAQLAAIERLPGVERVQPVARATATRPPVLAAPTAHDPGSPRPRSAGDEQLGVALEQLDVLQIPWLHKCGLTGAGVVVGVQDSGFSLEHAALMGIDVIAAHDFLGDDDIVSDEPGDANGQQNHGTMVLSLLAGNDPGRYRGAAPGVSVILSKTEDKSVEEPFEEDRFVEGLEWIESMGADLFTSSLGYVDWYAPEDLDGKTAVATLAATVALEQGLIVFTSIGNAGPDPTTLIAPSDADGVIAVGAVGLDGIVAEFSSRGPTADGRVKPDIAAPGADVWVADPNSLDEYGQGDGTSFATPLAAGAAALLLQALPDLDPASMRALLQEHSSLAGAPNNDMGWGVLDPRLPVGPICTCTDEDLDGALASDCGGDDCDDADPAVHPGAIEQCADGLDNDCSGLADAADPACDGEGDGDGDGDGGASAGGLGGGDDGDDGDGDPGDAGGPPDASGDLMGGAEGCAIAATRASERALLLLAWLLGLGLRRRPGSRGAGRRGRAHYGS